MKKRGLQRAAGFLLTAALLCSAAAPARAVWVEVPPVTLARAVRDCVRPIFKAVRRAASPSPISTSKWTDIPVFAHAMGTGIRGGPPAHLRRRYGGPARLGPKFQPQYGTEP